MIELARRYGVPKHQVRVVDGPVSEVLPRVAEWEGSDIVAMGAVSRSWIKRLLVGHTAVRVLDAMDSDVLVVKPPGFRTTIGRQSMHHVDRAAGGRSRSIS